MHLTRAKVSKKWPIPRKGTKYVARPFRDINSGVSVVVAIRDMLKLAKTSREVKHMVHNKLIKINDKTVGDIKECVRLFDIMDSDKRYKLIVLPTGRFNFEESKNDFILSKVLNKRLVKSGKIQLNLYNGENVISDKKINVGDSVELDFDCKIRKVLPLKEGAKILVSSGKNIGRHGTVRFIDGKKVNAVLDNKKEAELDVRHIFVI